jgi:hypothetical protein
MARVVDLIILVIILFAITSNCVQAAQVTLDPTGFSVSVISASSALADDSEVLLADDESDDTPNLILLQNSFSPIEATGISVAFPILLVAAVQVERSTILRI